MNKTVSGLIEKLEKLLLARGQQLSVAESCTGGLLSSWICVRSGVSSWYTGAVVIYARQVKKDVLQVPESLIAVHGEVSVPVARAMAEGARQMLGSDWAVSITGIAGPGGGTPVKPVGTVCFAVVGPGVGEGWGVFISPEKGREDVQQQAATRALELLIRQIED